MEESEMYEKKVKNFEKRVYRAMDLMKDAYKYKCMAEYYSNNDEDRQRFKEISKTLMDRFMQEHNSIGDYFKEEE